MDNDICGAYVASNIFSVITVFSFLKFRYFCFYKAVFEILCIFVGIGSFFIKKKILLRSINLIIYYFVLLYFILIIFSGFMVYYWINN
jgi:hypothetical protein